jgi:uncharacterized protein DUF3631
MTDERTPPTMKAALNGAAPRPALTAPPPQPEEDLSTPLDSVRDFLAGILYATDEQLDALALVMAVTHATDAFTTLPRVLVTSEKPQTGKSIVLTLAQMLCANGWKADPTGPALKAKFIEPQPDGGTVTLILDEISKVFGESGLNGRTSPIYKILVDGYANDGTFNHSVAKVAMDVSCFCVAFMAGLRTAAPEDLKQRSIHILMKPKPGSLALENARDPDTKVDGDALGVVLHGWVRENTGVLREISRNRLHGIHPKLTDRRREIWGPLFAVAMAEGGDWPQRCMGAFRKIALDASDGPRPTIPQQIVMDLADLIERESLPQVFAIDAVEYLRAMIDRPEYEALSDRGLAKRIAAALGESQTIRGRNRAGAEVLAKGRYSPRILHLAAALRAHFEPVITEAQPDQWDEELTPFTTLDP